jgi:hypothetical protein
MPCGVRNTVNKQQVLRLEVLPGLPGRTRFAQDDKVNDTNYAITSAATLSVTKASITSPALMSP